MKAIPEPKIAVITDEFSNEFDEVLEYLASVDVHYAELRKVWAVDIAFLMSDMQADAKDLLKEFDIEVSCISGSLLKCVPPGSPEEKPGKESPSKDFNFNLSLAEKYIELAEYFGAKFIRCFGFHPGGYSQPYPEEMWTAWVGAVKSILDKIEGRDITLVCENEAGCTINTIETMQKAVSLIEHPQFRLLYDPANLFHAGEMVTDETYPFLQNHVGYVHAKDGKVNPEGGRETTVVGDGDCNLESIFNRLRDDGYDSFFSIETHMKGKGQEKWDNSVRALDALKHILHV